MLLKTLAALALLGLALLACGDGATSVERQVAATLEGWFEAYANNKPDALAGYWSQDCTAEQVRQSAAAAEENQGRVQLAGGDRRYDIEIDPDKLRLDTVDDAHVSVPLLSQPEGALSATRGGKPITRGPSPEMEVIDLSREDGEWKIASCLVLVDAS